MPIACSWPSQGEGEQLHECCMNAFVCARWIEQKDLHAFKGECSMCTVCQEEKEALSVCVCTSLTGHEAHQFVWQDAGGDESHPQADVKLPGALRLHPHEQADTQTHTNTHTDEGEEK